MVITVNIYKKIRQRRLNGESQRCIARVMRNILRNKVKKYKKIDSIPHRLRWWRYPLGLMQREVADLFGISRTTYIEMEIGRIDCFEREVADKLAVLYQIPVDNLIDEYNRLLYTGQGKLTRACRE